MMPGADLFDRQTVRVTVVFAGFTPATETWSQDLAPAACETDGPSVASAANARECRPPNDAASINRATNTIAR